MAENELIVDNSDLEDDKQLSLFISDASEFRSTSASSVQANVLIRTGLFTPIGRRSSREGLVQNDLSEHVRAIELVKKEGFDSVVITGERLSVETDFKVWTGIILAFSTYGLKTNRIRLPFSKFAKLCGYSSKRFDSNLRRQIAESLTRLGEQKIRFRSTDPTGDKQRGVNTGLVLRSEYDSEADFVDLMADESLWELYRIDRQTIVNMRVIEALPRAEVAQCLYLFFLSLPPQPYPISFTRLRERLQLQSVKKEANRRIKIAIKKLEEIGFVSGLIFSKNGETYYKIYGRDRTLKNPEKLISDDLMEGEGL